MKTIDLIITKVGTKFGAPMGRQNIGHHPHTFTSDERNKQCISTNNVTIFDCRVPMNGAYDKGGAYWGLGKELRVSYTKDLSYINFYRVGEEIGVIDISAWNPKNLKRYSFWKK